MGSRVLYIEDNVDNLILVRRILGAEGYSLLEATSAKEGIALAEQHIPDLILMDVNMPEMDGLTATKQLRQNPALKDVPIVALTANIMRDVLAEVMDAGCDGFITKPITVDEFPDQVLKFVSQGRVHSGG
jgi:two-component system, cell cycle response regulator DivK